MEARLPVDCDFFALGDVGACASDADMMDARDEGVTGSVVVLV